VERPSSKKLIFVRHAHRDKTEGREKDNGLSRKGWKQAERVKRYFVSQIGKTKPRLLSSRKLRCMETLAPLADKLEASVDISPLLMEEEPGLAPLKTRVKKFCDEWKNSKEPLVVACSHGDWLPIALEHLTGACIELKKGGWAEMEQDGERIVLRNVLQELPD